MKYTTTYVVDTPNIVRHLERIDPKYILNYIALMRFIQMNKSSKYIVMVTPWMVNNLPNWDKIHCKNMEFKFSIEYYEGDPDMALFLVCEEEQIKNIISNDNFKQKKYRDFKNFTINKIGFDFHEKSSELFIKNINEEVK